MKIKMQRDLKESRKEQKIQEEREFINQVQECYQMELDLKLKVKEENEQKIKEMEELEAQLIDRMNNTLQREFNLKSKLNAQSVVF